MAHDPSHEAARPTRLEGRQAEGEYVDKDVETETPEPEREGEYVDKDVASDDTHPPQHSYVDKDIPS